ncbi:MAG: hypothetical protein C0407_15340 [Desulfobacca sp.]|nr:hypothetical protein [Desulfobacca sp.]
MKISHIDDMAFPMKWRIITELVKSVLRLLRRQKKLNNKKTLQKLPSFNGGIPKGKIANREARYNLMEGIGCLEQIYRLDLI